MADITELVLKVNADGVDKAKKKVDEFSSAMKDTESSSRTLEQGLSGATKGASSLGGVLSSIAIPTAVIASVKQLSGFIAKCTSAYTYQTQQINLLNSTLQATGATAWTNIDALTTMAQELQKATNYGDEEIEHMQTVLLGFRNITGEAFSHATEAILDMSTVMGMDLVSSAQAIGKALDNPVKGMDSLSRQGFKFTDEEKAMIKELVEAGNLLEAQNMVLSELDKTFGNAARTAMSPIKQFQNEMGDLRELIGQTAQQVLPITDGFNLAKKAVEGLSKALNAINKSPILQGTLKVVIVAATGAIVGMLIPAVTTLVAQLSAAAVAASMINPAGAAIGAGIAAAALGATALVSNLSKATEEARATEKEISNLQKKAKQGFNLSIDEEIKLANAQIKACKEQLDLMKASGNELVGTEKELANEIEKSIQTQQEKLRLLEEEKKHIDEVRKAYEAYNKTSSQRAIETMGEEQKAYEKALKDAESMYVKTDEGQLKKLQDDLKAMQKALNGYNKTNEANSLSRGITRVAPNDDERKKLENAAAELEKQIEQLTARMKGGNTKPESVVVEQIKGLPTVGTSISSLADLWESDTQNKLIEMIEQLQGMDKNSPDYDNLKTQIDATSQSLEGLTKSARNAEQIDLLIDNLQGGLVGLGGALKSIGNDRAFNDLQTLMRDRVAVRDENGKTTYEYEGKTLGATDYMSAYAKGMFSPEGFSEAFVGQLTSDFLPDLMGQLSDCIDTSSAGGKVAQVGLTTLQGMMNGQNMFQALSNGIWSSLLSWIQKDVQDQTEAERLEEIKEQLERQTEYIKDQLDYLHEVQLTMQAAFIDQQISAGSLTQANDMILTPNGQYSTAPDDYIMAMKHPEDLGSGTIKMSVTINNTVSDTVQTSVEQTTTTDGTKELLVTISKKVAQDAANGTNGWDAALIQRDSRMKGRYVS